MVFDAPGIENFDFWCSGNRKHGFLTLHGQKILIYGASGTENINFWCSRDRKVLIFDGLGTKN